MTRYDLFTSEIGVDIENKAGGKYERHYTYTQKWELFVLVTFDLVILLTERNAKYCFIDDRKII